MANDPELCGDDFVCDEEKDLEGEEVKSNELILALLDAICHPSARLAQRTAKMLSLMKTMFNTSSRICRTAMQRPLDPSAQTSWLDKKSMKPVQRLLKNPMCLSAVISSK
jgi:hypothetical protein